MLAYVRKLGILYLGCVVHWSSFLWICQVFAIGTKIVGVWLGLPIDPFFS